MNSLTKKELLHQVARDYKTKGLGAKNFHANPYDEDVVLRAPLCPGGFANPHKGEENLRTIWWVSLPTLVGEVKVIDSFVNENNTGSGYYHALTFRLLLFSAVAEGVKRSKLRVL